MKDLALPISKLPFDLSVVTPAKEKLVTSIAYFNCPLMDHNVTYLVNLICLPLFGLDAILGMNWLFANRVVINCSNKTISLLNNQCQLILLSNSFVSVVACLKSLVKGAQGYLFLFSVKVEAKNNMLAIPVVCEFQDDITREVFSLPPNRDVEFNIDLVPGSGLVLVAPYRMSPLELSELKKQLEEKWKHDIM